MKVNVSQCQQFHRSWKASGHCDRSINSFVEKTAPESEIQSTVVSFRGNMSCRRIHRSSLHPRFKLFAPPIPRQRWNLLAVKSIILNVPSGARTTFRGSKSSWLIPSSWISLTVSKMLSLSQTSDSVYTELMIPDLSCASNCCHSTPESESPA